MHPINERKQFDDWIVTSNGSGILPVWDQCAPIFDDAPVWKMNHINADLVLSKVMAGENLAHIGFSSPKDVLFLLVTHFEHYFDGKKTLFVDFFGGKDFSTWQREGFEYLDHFAKTHGCCAIEYVGRPGFSKINPAFQEDGRLYVKILEE